MLVATLVASGCGESGAAPPTAPLEPPRPTQVAVRPAQARLVALDATVQLTTEVRDQNGQIMSGAAVAWTSSDAAVARVNASGLVTAAGNGSATITAAVGGATGTATVTVEQEVAALAVGPEALAFGALGDTMRLTAEVADANGYPIPVERTAGVEWTSSDATVVHVDAAGLVTAVGNGSATITASVGGAAGTATATVEQEAAALTLSAEALLFGALGDTLRLVAEAADANGHPMEVAWASSDAAVARVEVSGLVTAVGNGSATITVTAGPAVRSAVVVVDQVAVVFDLAPEAVKFRLLGDTLRLVAAAADANGYAIESVTWTSSNATVATVDSTGLVTARRNGSARITATASGATRSSAVTVEQEAVALGGLPVADTLLWYGEPGDTLRLVATAVDANGHPVESIPIKWSTSLAGVATVDDGGLVKGAGEGVARITATAGNLRASTELTVVNRDRAALAALYHATGGPGWRCNDNWTTPARMDTWCGVGTSIRADGVVMVTTLSLEDNQLTGSIPPELGNLANLQDLRLRSNQLWGPIPLELGSLVDLELLHLGSNVLTGPIPPELGNLTNLEVMYLGANQLWGPIPPELGNLASLQDLWLAYNQLTGSIPSELGHLANLNHLSLDDNQLTGLIPPELGNLTRLSAGLHLRGNQLTGPIPPELGNLNLRELSLGGNQLTGLIPSELGNLANLTGLWLGGNRLTGPIPPELGNITGLQHLNLNYNQLIGPIPDELGNLADLVELHFHGNTTLSGRLPDTLTRLGLITFSWDDTQLCHPPTAAFQQWLQSIRNHRGGPPCGS